MKLGVETWRAFLERARAANQRRDDAVRARGLKSPVEAGAVMVARECMDALEFAMTAGDAASVAEAYALLEAFVESEEKKGGV